MAKEPIENLTLNGSITCSRCDAVNALARRFCAKCGKVLWKTCPKCEADCPLQEAFCSQCGDDLASRERLLIEQAENRLADIHTMIDQCALNDAILALRVLDKDCEHPQLDPVREKARALVARLATERDAWDSHVKKSVQQARLLVQAYQYAAAVAELESIPEPIRDDECQRLWKQATEADRETRLLKQAVCQKNNGTLQDQILRVDRLLELNPDDSQVRKWHATLCDLVQKAARKKVQQRQFREALAFMDAVSGTASDQVTQRLRSQIAELAWLDAESRLAPLVDKTLVNIAQRLVKATGGDSTARRRLEKIMACREAAERSAQKAAAVWAASPASTYLGPPVNYFSGLRNIRCPSSDETDGGPWQTGQFCTAMGLALQALGQAANNINLRQSNKRPILRRLQASWREREPRAAWGIDISGGSVKAVKLAGNQADQLMVEKSCLLPVQREAGQPYIPGEGDAVAEQLQQLIARESISSSDRIAVNWPTVRALTRFMTVPAVPDKRLQQLIKFEAQQQIPFPMDEVDWDFDLLPGKAQVDAEKLTRQEVLLLAARSREISQYVSMLAARQMDVSIVQCEALALHNLFQYAYTDAGRGGDPRGVLIVDVGSSWTNIVASCSRHVLYRSIHLGGDDLTKALVKRFQLTTRQAQELCHSPVKAKRLSEVAFAFEPVFSKLAEEVRQVMSDANCRVDGQAIDEVICLGGASRTLGLIRYLRQGRYLEDCCD